MAEEFKKTINKIGVAIGVVDEPPKSAVEQFTDEFDKACSLDRTTRLYVFGTCFVLGWILSLMSLVQLPHVATGHPAGFAILYTFGNIISLVGTAFLWGPCAQLKSMFAPVRAVATVVYLLSIVLTLVVVFRVGNVGLVFLCMLFQFAAMVWYVLSYIPYGRTMLKGCVGNMCQV